MARRRKAHKKVSHRRRKMSGIGAIGGTAMTGVYAIAGAAAAQFVAKMLPATMDEKIKAAIPLAAGLFLPKLVKGSAGAGLGAGMVAVGGLKLVQSFGVLNGIGAISPLVDYKTPLIGAYYENQRSSMNTPVIAGFDELGC